MTLGFAIGVIVTVIVVAILGYKLLMWAIDRVMSRQ